MEDGFSEFRVHRLGCQLEGGLEATFVAIGVINGDSIAIRAQVTIGKCPHATEVPILELSAGSNGART